MAVPSKGLDLAAGAARTIKTGKEDFSVHRTLSVLLGSFCD